MAADVPKPRNVKKIVIIAVSAIASVVIVLTAILVGMYIFAEANKEIIKVVYSHSFILGIYSAIQGTYSPSQDYRNCFLVTYETHLN